MKSFNLLHESIVAHAIRGALIGTTNACVNAANSLSLKEHNEQNANELGNEFEKALGGLGAEESSIDAFNRHKANEEIDMSDKAAMKSMSLELPVNPADTLRVLCGYRNHLRMELATRVDSEKGMPPDFLATLKRRLTNTPVVGGSAQNVAMIKAQATEMDVSQILAGEIARRKQTQQLLIKLSARTLEIFNQANEGGELLGDDDTFEEIPFLVRTRIFSRSCDELVYRRNFLVNRIGFGSKNIDISPEIMLLLDGHKTLVKAYDDYLKTHKDEASHIHAQNLDVPTPVAWKQVVATAPVVNT